MKLFPTHYRPSLLALTVDIKEAKYDIGTGTHSPPPPGSQRGLVGSVIPLAKRVVTFIFTLFSNFQLERAQVLQQRSAATLTSFSVNSFTFGSVRHPRDLAIDRLPSALRA